MPTSREFARTAALVFPACAALWLAAAPPPALADTDRFAADATAGIALPTTPIAGDQDATATALNPAGLIYLGGWHLEAALTGLDENHAEGPGAGIGVFAAVPLHLPFLPRLGFGAGIEALTPPRIALIPDPGTPLRLTVAAAWEQRGDLALGLSWHHFVDSDGGVLDGVDTFDAGLSARFGAYLAVGLVAKDLFTPPVAGVPVQRHYDGELVARPLATDRLELGLGLGFGERRHDLEPRLRVSWRVTHGVWVRAQAEAREIFRLDMPAFGGGPVTREWDGRATLGFELSLGGVGGALYGTAGLDRTGGAHMLGGTVMVRDSSERLPSAAGRPDRIERFKLSGALGDRALASTLLRLRRIERDPGVVAVLVQLDGIAGGWATLQELRDGLSRVKKRGKKVFAYFSAGTVRDYYVGAVADRLYLDAAGGVRLAGLASTALYFKGFLEKLGVDAQFEKIEEYKSAPEEFTRDSSSGPAKEMRDSLFDDIYAQVTGDLAHDRSPARDQAAWKKIFDDGPYTAGEAGATKLVDAVVEPRDVDDLLAKELGRVYPISDGDPEERDPTWAYPKIAVIYLDGDIVDGKSQDIPILGQHLVGGQTIAESIAWARESPDIVAIVLRIDSPGGSALASEVIAREVFATRGRKPILVSMGDVAASGGYFAAAGGDRIFAQPGTITGSIGIFTGKADVSGLLAKLGITTETTTRGAHADMESPYRPYTDEERVQVKQKLRYYYDRFRQTVARGRGMTMEKVDELGRGRVWTGAQAKARGLVDDYGTLADVIVLAKSRAGYGEGERVEVVALPKAPASIVGTLLKLIGGGDEDASASVTLASLPPVILDVLRVIPASILFGRGDEPQARLPFAIVFE